MLGNDLMSNDMVVMAKHVDRSRNILDLRGGPSQSGRMQQPIKSRADSMRGGHDESSQADRGRGDHQIHGNDCASRRCHVEETKLEACA